MKKIDMEHWKRKKYFEFYKDYTFPHFSMTVNLDITDLIHYIKEQHIAFFPTFIYLFMKAMNDIDEFKYRIRGQDVVLHDEVTPSYTVLNQDDLYVFCTTEYNSDYKTFYQAVLEDIKVAKTGNRLEDLPGRDNLVFVSSIPWKTYTQITHPIDTNHPDSFPRITFGKYFEESEAIKIPFTIYVHHGLCDGLHVSNFLDDIQKNIALFINQKI